MKHTTFKRHPLSRLSISENKRYFIKEDGTPFLWLADTVWTLPQRMKWDDVEYYMQTRKNQGFTVLQIVALDPERDEDIRNPANVPLCLSGLMKKRGSSLSCFSPVMV